MILHLLPAQALAHDTRRLPAQRLFDRGLNPLLRLLAQRDGGRFAYLACPFGLVLPNEIIDAGELISARSLSLEAGRLWALAIYGGLRRALPRGCDEVVFYGSPHSHSHLGSWLVRDGWRVSCPLDGMDDAGRRAWVNAQMGEGVSHGDL